MHREIPLEFDPIFTQFTLVLTSRALASLCATYLAVVVWEIVFGCRFSNTCVASVKDSLIFMFRPDCRTHVTQPVQVAQSC